MEIAHQLDEDGAGGQAIRGGVLRLAGYLIGLLSSVVSAAILFRHLGVVDTGRYVLVLSLLTVAAGLSDAGLATLGTRELAVRPAGSQRDAFLRNLLGVRIALSIAGTALACGYAAITGLGHVLVVGTLVVGLAMLAQNAQLSLATSLMAQLRLGAVTAADLVRQLLTSIGVVVFALAGAHLASFFWVSVIGAVAALAFTARLVADMPRRPAVDLRVWRTLLRETLPFALTAAVGAVYFRMAILMVQLLSSAHQVGLFGASFRIVEVLVIVPQLVVSSAFPIFARAAGTDHERLGYALQRMLDACLILGAAIALLVSVGAPVIIDILAGPRFHGAQSVLRLHGLALLFSSCAAVFGYGLLSVRHYRGLVLANLAALAVSVVASLLLVPDDGARGGALATVAGELTLVLGAALALARAPGGAVALRVPAAPRIALAVALAAAPAFVLPALPAMVLAAAIFFGLILVLRVVPQELLIEARSALARVRAARAAAAG